MKYEIDKPWYEIEVVDVGVISENGRGPSDYAI